MKCREGGGTAHEREDEEGTPEDTFRNTSRESWQVTWGGMLSCESRPYLSPWHPEPFRKCRWEKQAFGFLITDSWVPERLAGKGQTPEGDLLERHACTCSPVLCGQWELFGRLA